MRVLELPILRAGGDIVAVVIEQAELAGAPVTVVTVRDRPGATPHRRWYPDPAAALAYGGERAERHGLALIDLREPSE